VNAELRQSIRHEACDAIALLERIHRLAHGDVPTSRLARTLIAVEDVARNLCDVVQELDVFDPPSEARAEPKQPSRLGAPS
jgi:hypothetical protein